MVTTEAFLQLADSAPSTRLSHEKKIKGWKSGVENKRQEHIKEHSNHSGTFHSKDSKHYFELVAVLLEQSRFAKQYSSVRVQVYKCFISS